MNYFSKKNLLVITLLGILSSPSYAENTALEPVTITVGDTQINVNSSDITSAINQLMKLGLDVDSVVTLLINAGFDSVKVTESFVTAYPKLVLEIVESVTKANPNKAGDIAGAAATLLPEQAADIAGAAAKQVTSIGQAHQIAYKVGMAVHAQKVDGIPDAKGQAIAKAIIANAPSGLGITLKVLAHVATSRSKITKEPLEENPSQNTPISPS